MRVFAGVLLLVALASPLPGQSAARTIVPDSAYVPPPALRHPPLYYFALSGLVPGWGQAKLDRKLTAGLFIVFEGLAVSMAMKSYSEIKFLDRGDSVTSIARHAERQDWFVLIGFNHLFSALEAFVSAHLIDFPPDLKMRMLPGGRMGIGITIGGHH
jgi:hypothetical protein